MLPEQIEQVKKQLMMFSTLPLPSIICLESALNRFSEKDVADVIPLADQATIEVINKYGIVIDVLLHEINRSVSIYVCSPSILRGEFSYIKSPLSIS